MAPTLAEIPTPALVLDVAKLRSNVRRMSQRMRQHHIHLRPHVKTSKSIDVAKIVTADEFGGITVSTLAEAEYFASYGYTDITYAVGILPDKLERVAALYKKGVTLRLLLDSVVVAQAVAEEAKRRKQTLEVLIEVDCGHGRAGVSTQSDVLIHIGRVVHDASHLVLAGVLTHGGHSYDCDSLSAVKEVATTERSAATTAAKRLGDAGLPCEMLSAGSTPTAVHGESFAGITEMRPGNFVFYDLFQHGLGSCDWEDIALTVLASVTSFSTERSQLLVDAGGLALSKDTGARRFWKDVGFGWVTDLQGKRINQWVVGDVDQEHGFIKFEQDPVPWDNPLGQRVRILPNHACMTAAAHDRYYVVDSTAENPTAVVGEWHRCAGW